MALIAGTVAHGTAASAAPILVPLYGSGSTWSGNAMKDWIANIKDSNIVVDYNDQGSTFGRTQFYQGAADFALSEIPYGLADAFAEADLVPDHRSFAYMPVVAGGTSIMYHLRIGGKKVTNLRLSGDTLVRIFTKEITMWDHADIKRDNPGLLLPPRRIIPVVRGDGSGTTAQFTQWMSKQYPQLWGNFCRAHNSPHNPCPLTSFWPTTGYEAKRGSDGVAGYVSQANSDGAITYVEYSYAREALFPVAKIKNAAGYYTEPTPLNVAVALTQARITNNPSDPKTHLTQNLDNVYSYNDKRSYPLSSYSYMILPTAYQNGFNENKGYTLGEFAYFFLCEGQRSMEQLGYSPLPVNLVQEGFKQVARIPGVAIRQNPGSNCNNPTLTSDGNGNRLAEIAPQPNECDNAATGKQNPAPTGGAEEATPVSTGSCTGAWRWRWRRRRGAPVVVAPAAVAAVVPATHPAPTRPSAPMAPSWTPTRARPSVAGRRAARAARPWRASRCWPRPTRAGTYGTP